MKLKSFLAALAAVVGLSVQAQSWTASEVGAGKFFLYNVGKGQFLTRGNGWGTQASASASSALTVTVEEYNGAYKLRTDVNGSGKGLERLSDPVIYTDQSASKNSTWTFTKVADGSNGPVYTIVSAANHGGGSGSYMTASADNTIVGPADAVTDDYGRWQLLQSWITNSVPVNDANGWTVSQTPTFDGGNVCAEYWNKSGASIKQTLSNLPAGSYELIAVALTRTGMTATLNAGTNTMSITTAGSDDVNNRTQANTWFNNGNGVNTLEFTHAGGNLEIGLTADNTTGDHWLVWRSFALIYKGLDLSVLKAALQVQIDAVPDLEGTTTTAAYNAAKNYADGIDMDALTTEEAISEASTELANLVSVATALQSNVTRYNNIKSAALVIATELDTEDADAAFAAATTNDAINAAIATLRAAFLAELPNVTIPQDPGYIDVTSVMVDNATVSQNTNYWTIANLSSSGGSAGVCNYGECEFYNRNFKFYQTLSLTSGTWEFGVTGFHRAGNHKTYFYAGDDKILIPGVASDVVNTMAAAKDYFDAGNGKVSLKFLMEAADNIEIGIDNQDTETDKWTIFRNFTLKYYGAPDYSTYVTRLNDALDATLSGLEALEGKVPAVITNEAGTLETTYRDAELANKAAYLAAIELVEGKLTTAQSLEAPYTAYKAAATAAETEGVNASLLSTQNTAVDEATTVAAVKECLAEVQYARMTLAVADKTNVDLTSFIINPGFEEGNLNGWTNDGDTPFQAQGNKAFGGTVGEYYAERWHVDATLDINQTLTYLPAGLYKVSVNALAEYEGGVLYANAEETSLGATNTYEQLVKVDDRGSLKIGAKGGLSTSTWFCVDNFTLTYVAEDFVYTLVTGKLNATVAAAQTEAEETFNGEKSITNYNALLAAIAAAQASKDAYTAAAAALTKANSILNSTNVYTAEARTAYTDAITAAQAAYDDNSMTTETASGLNAALNNADWGAAQPTGAAYIGSAWTGTNINYNFWSWEGDGEGASGMSTPFVQYWVADAEKLANNTITATLSGLENGLYSVTAFMRVFNNKEGDDAGYDGISLAVNDGTPVAFADATEYTDGYAKEITAEGLVKDGNLIIKVAIEGTNASWVAFKNVNYTKVRDLTEEEMAVVPTAIALYNGEEEVTEPIALNKTENTVTLTPAYTPADASEGYIEWASTDDNVATVVDGVVTAVLPGTTTITATSTLDNTVSASATVTVTFPETEVVTESYVNDGAIRTVVTLGENLIKNGAFEYPNSFYGWTNGSGAAMSSDNFNLVTEDDNHYIKAKGHTGAGGVNSVGTGWTIEAGKTYVFGYKVKSTSAGNSEFHVVSLTNTLGTETQKVSKTETAVGTDWTNVSYTFTNPEENGYAYVQFRARWLNSAVSFDDFYLQEVTSENIIGNVQYALDAIPTANIGTGAFQYSQDAIDAANALVQGEATVEQVQAAYDALTTINEPAEGQLFNVILTYGGWTYDQKAMTYIANGRNDGGLYNIQYKEAANQNLAQAFTFTKVSGNNYKMSQIDADGNARYISTGVPYSGNTSQIRTVTDAENALVVTVIPTATEGKWNLRNTAANQYIGSQDAGVYTVNSHIDFNIVETAKPSIAINTTAAGWGTVMLPFAAEIPEGVKAYSVSETNGNVLALDEAETLEANKPYILEGELETVLTGDAQGTALTYTNGLLTGVYAATPAPVGSYVLQKNNDVVGFYQVAEGEQPTVGANRAYLTVENAAGVKAFFFDSTATAIQNVMSGAAAGEIYDLSGRKVSKMQRGNTYIVNGQKVMVK